jgi:uncharacterized membrane protein
MRWIHISSVVTLVGGIMYARFIMIPASQELSADAQAAVGNAAAFRFRPVVFTVIAALLLSGVYNFLLKPGHSPFYQMLFGIKMLLVLHVWSVAILVTAPNNDRRARQLFGAAVSGLAIVLISAYLKGIA